MPARGTLFHLRSARRMIVRGLDFQFDPTVDGRILQMLDLRGREASPAAASAAYSFANESTLRIGGWRTRPTAVMASWGTLEGRGTECKDTPVGCHHPVAATV
jgi:hypothetical protein